MMKFMPALLLAFLGGFPFSAGAESPTQALRQTQARIQKLLRQKAASGSPAEKKLKKEIQKAVNRLLDFNELAKLSLGKHWQERNGKERGEFATILKDLIERNYVKQLSSNLGYKIEYRQEKIAGETALVKTAVKVQKNDRVTEILIDYKMRQNEGIWMVYDVITDEVSIVDNYRSQFNRIIRKESYEALVKKMRRKLEETS